MKRAVSRRGAGTGHGAGTGRVWLGAIALVVATFVAYKPAMNAGFVWDDDDYVTDNTLLRSPEGLVRLWEPGQTHQYYPAVFTTFWLEYHLWGLDPHGYHVVNVVLHVANALLLWRVLTLLGVPGAWMIAAVFALHPMHVESVAWITERKNVLSALFYLLATLAWLRFDPMRDEGGAPPAAPRAWRAYALSLLFFVLALLSKSVTCTLPAALVLVMVARRQRLGVRRLLPLAPMVVVGLAAALHTAHLERTSVGAVGAAFDFSFVERCLIAARALLHYPFKLLAPWPLVFTYPRWTIDVGDWRAWMAVAAVTAAGVAALVAFRRGRRGPAVALAFYAATIFPALGFVDYWPMVYSFVADHFSYLASIGLIALVVAPVARRAGDRRGARLAAGLVLLVYGGLTWREGGKYETEETLWRTTLAQNPDSWMAHNNLGVVLLRDQGRRRGRPALDEAVEQFKASLEINPDNDQAVGNLAVAMHREGRYPEALAYWQQLLAGGHATPEDRYRMGVTLEAMGRTEAAIADYRGVVRDAPDHLAARLHLGQLLRQAGRDDEAAEQFEYLVARYPGSTSLQLFLGERAEKDGNWAKAVDTYETALRWVQDPADAASLSRRLARIRALCPDPRFLNADEALRRVQPLLRDAGGADPEALYLRAAALAQLGRLDEAVRDAERALALARERGMSDLAAEIAARLETFRAG